MLHVISSRVVLIMKFRLLNFTTVIYKKKKKKKNFVILLSSDHGE